jgi:hypothetical protein
MERLAQFALRDRFLAFAPGGPAERGAPKKEFAKPEAVSRERLKG